MDSKIIFNKKAHQLVVEEKGYAGRLSTLGKISCFSEYFDGVKIEDKDIQSVAPFEYPRECQSFKSGYQRAMALIQNGFTKEDYYNFLENINKKEKALTLEVLEIAYNRKQEKKR